MTHLSFRHWIWLLLFVGGILFLGHTLAKSQEDDGPDATRAFRIVSVCYPAKEGLEYLSKSGYMLIGAGKFEEGFDELVFLNRKGELFVVVRTKDEICKLANTVPLVGIDQFIDLSKFPVAGESN